MLKPFNNTSWWLMMLKNMGKWRDGNVRCNQLNHGGMGSSSLRMPRLKEFPWCGWTFYAQDTFAVSVCSTSRNWPSGLLSTAVSCYLMTEWNLMETAPALNCRCELLPACSLGSRVRPWWRITSVERCAATRDGRSMIHQWLCDDHG